MKKSIICAAILLAAANAASAAASPHVIQGIRVGANKYKILSTSGFQCIKNMHATLPYEERSDVEALVCTWTSKQPDGGSARIVLNTIVPDTVEAKLYAPFSHVGELTARYPATVSYDKLRAEFDAAPLSETKPGKGQAGEAYWGDGELLTRLSCAKTGCIVTSGTNFARAFRMQEERRAAAKEEKKKAEAAAQKPAGDAR
ncbi:MAG: hypothetical protein V4724_27000 [Pseudomonadota bacterium]